LEQPPIIDGHKLAVMLQAGAHWLERHASAVDALNVFPVPDGDTGTNMLLTLKSALAELARAKNDGAGGVAAAAAHGALLGARGNSGVILSQILHGFAQSIGEREQITGSELAQALLAASDAAYRSVSQPVEGTMLTVVRESAQAAMQAADSPTRDVSHVLGVALQAGKTALANTPNLLPVLKQAGVVDAGGQGLVLILEGAHACLEGRILEHASESLGEIRQSWLDSVARAHGQDHGEAWGYCTQFIILQSALSLEEVAERVKAIGTSTLVVGDASAIRVHLHTPDPGAALSFGTSTGTLDAIKVDNMSEQHKALVASRQKRVIAPAVPVVAVAPGAGLAQVFRSLGATEIVSGGQSMNPSTREIADAVEAIPADAVVVLPNNPNVVRACEQVQQLTEKRIEVLPTLTIPQGIAALLALNQEASIDENLTAMRAALESVRTIEITRATRAVTLDGVAVKEGQPICLLDRKLAAAGETVLEAFMSVLDEAGCADGGLLTLYYGENVTEEESRTLAAALQDHVQGLEVEVVWGGQPHYLYIASLEQ